MAFLVVFGTRPEAVKLAPVIASLKAERAVETQVCLTGQHRELVESALDFYGISPDFNLDLMTPGQQLNGLVARLLGRLDAIMERAAPDRVIVQGDTSTATAAAIAAFHRGIPVAHVEAGLRTYRAGEPFPEELNRRTIGLIADLHFAPTRGARDNLLRERLCGEVLVTGNSGVDALDMVLARLEADPALRRAADAELPAPTPGRKQILVTAHRRESSGDRFSAVCGALVRLVERRPDVEIVFPLHPAPGRRASAEAALEGHDRIHLLAPLGLAAFIRLMQRADLVLTDSGGVQEDAVTLGRKLIVMRDVTERPEGIEAGAALSAGTDPERILEAAEELLAAPPTGERSHLYGDGHAAERIVAGLRGRPVEEFARDWPRIESLRRIG